MSSVEAPLDRFYSWKERIVFVSNIPFHYKAQDVMLVMRQFGRCFRVDLARTEDGKSRGFCFVEYEKRESAALAAKYLDGAHFDNRFLRAEISKFPPDALVDIYKATAQQRAEKDRKDRSRVIETDDILGDVQAQISHPRAGPAPVDQRTESAEPPQSSKPKEEKHKHEKKRRDYSTDYSYDDYSYSYSDYSYSYSDSGYSYSYSYSDSDSDPEKPVH